VNLGNNASYTCLLVNPVPSSLTHNGVSDTNPWVIPVVAAGAYDTIEIQWSTTGATTANCPTTTNFTPAWNCAYGVLRASLVKTSGALTSAGLAASQLTGYWVPQLTAGPGLLAYGGNAGKANIVKADCNATNCSAWITGLAGNNYTLLISSLYKTAGTVTVIARSGGPNGTVVQTNGQVQIDATGDAGGVLRRIQVAIPATNTNTLVPGYALQTNGSICKRFGVTPGYFDIANDLPSSDPDASGSDLCSQLGPFGTPAP